MYNIYSNERVQLDGALAGVPSLRGRGETVAWSPKGDALAVTTLDGGRVYLNSENDLLGNAPFEAVPLTEAAMLQFIWSPDGHYLAGEAENNIWWIYRREGQRMILHSAIPSSYGLAWYNNDEVVFAPGEGGLYLINLAQANAQTVLLDDTWTYQLPFMMPDGAIRVYGRQQELARCAGGFGSSHRFTA